MFQTGKKGFLNEQRQRGMYVSKYLKQAPTIPPLLGFTLPCGGQSRPSGESYTTEEPQCTGGDHIGTGNRQSNRDWVKRKAADGVHFCYTHSMGAVPGCRRKRPGAYEESRPPITSSPQPQAVATQFPYPLLPDRLQSGLGKRGWRIAPSTTRLFLYAEATAL